MDKAVILAAGRGTRMQKEQQRAELTAGQSASARAGMKALMPVGRPFIDYVLSSLADSGFNHVCVVVGTAHQAILDHCRDLRPRRLVIEFAVQKEPLGTAHAALAASDFVGEEHFLLINGDNYYPRSALLELQQQDAAAVAAFTPHGLHLGNLTAARLRNFAVLTPRAGGTLARVIEKPTQEQVTHISTDIYINMNCWRFTPKIFAACRAIPLSPRKEYELTDAVNYAITQLGESFQMVPVDEPVLDLSTQADIAGVAQKIAHLEVEL